MEGYGQPAHGYGADPYAAQAYGGGVGAYGAVDPNAAAAAWDPSGGAHLWGHHHLNNQMAPQMAQPTGDCFPYVANHTSPTPPNAPVATPTRSPRSRSTPRRSSSTRERRTGVSPSFTPRRWSATPRAGRTRPPPVETTRPRWATRPCWTSRRLSPRAAAASSPCRPRAWRATRPAR